jgi:Rab proteins geranylgeranyltransferase component A
VHCRALAIAGKKVLHLDYNDYYGGSWATLGLGALQSALDGSKARPSDWNASQLSLDADQVDTCSLYPLHPPLQPMLLNSSAGAVVQRNNNAQQPEQQHAQQPEQQQDQQPKQQQQDEKSSDAADATAADNDGDTTSIKMQELLRDDRRYNIDLIPRGIWSNSKMVQQIVASGVNRYIDFKCYSAAYSLNDVALEPVPTSKSEVFSSDLSLREKRALMSFVKACMPDPHDEPDTSIDGRMQCSAMPA